MQVKCFLYSVFMYKFFKILQILFKKVSVDIFNNLGRLLARFLKNCPISPGMIQGNAISWTKFEISIKNARNRAFTVVSCKNFSSH